MFTFKHVTVVVTRNKEDLSTVNSGNKCQVWPRMNVTQFLGNPQQLRPTLWSLSRSRGTWAIENNKFVNFKYCQECKANSINRTIRLTRSVKLEDGNRVANEKFCIKKNAVLYLKHCHCKVMMFMWIFILVKINSDHRFRKKFYQQDYFSTARIH